MSNNDEGMLEIPLGALAGLLIFFGGMHLLCLLFPSLGPSPFDRQAPTPTPTVIVQQVEEDGLSE